jgi:hypothetical protein
MIDLARSARPALLIAITLLMVLQLVVGATQTAHAAAPALPTGAPNPLKAPEYELPGEQQQQAEAAIQQEEQAQSTAPSTVEASPLTPQTAPVGACAPGNVSSIAFDANVDVNISLFYSGYGGMAPVMNQVSAYAKNIVVTVDTDKINKSYYPIQQASLFVWAVAWNNNSLNSTLPNSPGQFPMLVNTTNDTFATAQLDDFKFYPPGSDVYFGIQIEQDVTTPGNWTSPCPIGLVRVVGTPPGNQWLNVPPFDDQPTWMYHIGNGWPSPYFANDFQVTATPNVFGGVIPDPFQSVYFFLNSTKIGFPIGGPLGGARLYYTLENQTGSHPGGASFCPLNSTFMDSCFGDVPFGIGPFYQVGDIVVFQFEAFVSTTVGIYNKIYSNFYSYEIGPGGTWCEPNSGYIFSHWIGTPEPPYYNSTWANGQYTGGADPATVILHGPIVEDALFNFVGSQTASGTGGPLVTSPDTIAPVHPGISLPPAPLVARPEATAVPGAGFVVSFYETGLPAGSTWSVLLGSTNQSSRSFWDNFTVATGTYAYQVTSPLSEFGQALVRYVASPTAGAVSVTSASVDLTISFTTQVYLDIEKSTYPPTNNPWDAGNVTTSPTAYGQSFDWFDNNTEVNLTATGFFGFPYFLSLTSNTYPFVVQSSTNDSIVPAFVGVVNVTLSSQNATTAIAYAYVFFNETYNGQVLNGLVLMNEVNSTVFYTGDGTQPEDPADLGPFPPGTNITFFVLAYDELGCPIRSLSYSFHTVVAPLPPKNGRTFFYVAVYDSGTGDYIPNVPVNISNNTWWDLTQTNIFGVAWPNASYSTTPLYLTYGYYNVTVTYDGFTQSVEYDLTPTSNKTLTFDFNSIHPIVVVYAAATAGFSPQLILGTVVAGATAVPIALVWSEQRRKAAAEEKRITL